MELWGPSKVKTKVYFAVGGSGVLVVLQGIPADPQEKMWCGNIYSGGNRRLSLCPIYVCPAMENIQMCLQQIQNKGQCPEFLSHIKVLSFGTCRQLLSDPSRHPGTLALFPAALLYPGSYLEPVFGVCVPTRPTWQPWMKSACDPGRKKQSFFVKLCDIVSGLE